MMLALVRHGATQANQEKRYLGKTDEPLSKGGKESLKLYKMQKIYPAVEYLFTSPMERCVDTAKIIYPAVSSIVIPEWTEIDFGRYEYKNYEELKDDVSYQEWIDSGGMLDFPEGEGRKDFDLRCKRGLFRMCHILSAAAAQNLDKPVFAVAVVHGGTIMSLLSAYCGGDYFDYQAPNGRGYVCRLTYVNDQTEQESKICADASICREGQEWEHKIQMKVIGEL